MFVTEKGMKKTFSASLLPIFVSCCPINFNYKQAEYQLA